MAMALAIFNEYAGVLSNVNACRDFFSWTASVITATRSSWNTSEVPDKDKTDAQKQTEEEIECLKADLWKLETTMPKMLDLIDRVEYQSHKKQAADLLPHIKDAVFEAEDLLDELDYDALKWKVECSKNLELNQLHDTCLEFYDSVRSNDYIRKVNRIQRNLDHVHQQSMEMGLHQAPLKFDRSVRPETTSYFTCEEKLVGREEEMKELVEILGVRGQKRGRTGSKSRMTELPVFSIVGMGGVGKTTMAQQICKDTNVKDHFDHIIWTCVSDDFDIKRLTKEIIEHLGGDASSNNLNVLMGKLEGCVKSKKFLLVLDDMWDDILENNGAGWKSFSAPLKNGAKGSKILVTTRSPEVAKLVGPMNNYELKGLQDEVFWDFFKSCAFGSTSSCSNRKSLECIGKKIVPKLKGSPLAARTIGRLLGMELSTTHWENIMESELWQIEQKEFDILPALRLSYMCLPQKLKRCFSVCAIFPKDHKFAKEFLANIWIAQGYVVGPQEASLCFDALANRSFFQEASPDSNKYVIHDLMHDTAQLVSKDECFIIKHASDLDNVPSNVRHLSILTNRNVQCSELKRICNKKKLRSLVCCESYSSTRDFESVIDCWFKELLKIRVLSFELSRVGELPESMGNSKHLRYLRLLGSRTFSIFPSSVCRLHHLKIIDCGNCLIERFPPGFSDALSLQKIKSKSFAYTRDHHSKLCLNWSGLQSSGHMMEILPHWNIQHLHVKGYRGESFPSWLLQPNLLPSLEELHIRSCCNLTSIVSEAISSSSSSSSGVQGFSSLARISIRECHKLLSFDEFLKPDCLPAVKTIWVSFCRELMSLPVDGLDGLQELEIRACNFKLNSQRVMILPPSLKKLELRKCDGIESINLANSRLGSSPVLEELMITRCPGLKSIGGAAAVDKIKKVDIWGCRELKEIQQPLRR